MKHRYTGIILGTAIFALTAGFIGFWMGSRVNDSSIAAKGSNPLPFLAKRLFVESPNDVFINFVPLRHNLETKLEATGKEYSLYFEYLSTGTSFSLGDKQRLVAASLIKLPYVMNLYRAAELGRINLDSSVTIDEDTVNNQYGDLYKRGVGTKLTLREAATYAITKSDNTAILIVQKHLKGLIDDNETAISAVDADYNSENDMVFMDARAYSSVLKCLYFACYLNKADSNEILHVMTESEFSDRLVAGVPKTVQVAHKIGVNYAVDHQSDCGIVYAPKRPYMLCIMLSGEESETVPIMKEISETVYRAVSRTGE